MKIRLVFVLLFLPPILSQLCFIINKVIVIVMYTGNIWKYDNYVNILEILIKTEKTKVAMTNYEKTKCRNTNFGKTKCINTNCRMTKCRYTNFGKTKCRNTNSGKTKCSKRLEILSKD